MKPALATTAASNKTSSRMTDGKRTAPKAPWKAKKRVQKSQNVLSGPIMVRLRVESRLCSALINAAINGFLHPG